VFCFFTKVFYLGTLSVCMNLFDLILGGFLIYGIIRGIWNGFFVELASFVSLILGIYIAIKFSFLTQSVIEDHVSWSPKAVQICAFALTFVLVVVGITALAKVFTTLANFASLGLVNKIGGGFFGLLKTILILSVSLHFFHRLNEKTSLVSKETLVESLIYYPTLEVSGMVYPALENWFTAFKEQEGAN
jgi:membrane protein required for colicin V production